MATRESVREWLNVWRIWALWWIVFICGLRGESFVKVVWNIFAYELSNHLMPLILILMVELVLSISSRHSMNYPTKRLITQGQSNLCLCLFVAMVSILDLFYLCSMCLGSIIACSSHQDLWGVLLLFFCNVEQSMYIENSADLILLCLKVGAIFFKYRDVIKAATCFHSYDDYKWHSTDVCRKCE